jgi:RNA polymerase sigma-70 factor (ECF subfamily)
LRDASDSEDLQLVEAFLGGDESAFRTLFDKYREKVFGVAFRFVRHHEDALEITQDVFLRVYLGLSQFRTNSKFFTWLYRIAVNRAIDYRRSRKSTPISGFDPSELESSASAVRGDASRSQPSPGDIAEERELREELAEAVDRLSPKHRAVFLLHASENLSYKEIAAVVGCNIGTVMSRLFYARKSLREELERRGFVIPATSDPRESEQ